MGSSFDERRTAQAATVQAYLRLPGSYFMVQKAQSHVRHILYPGTGGTFSFALALT